MGRCTSVTGTTQSQLRRISQEQLNALPNFRSPRSGLGWETGLNLQLSISTKPAAWKTKEIRAIGLSAASHIWNHVDAVESMGGGSIMSSELLQKTGASQETCTWKYFGAYFCGAGGCRRI